MRASKLRSALGALVTAVAGQRPARPAPHLQGDTIARELRQDGLSFLPVGILSQEAVASVKAHLKGRPVSDQYDGVSARGIDGTVPRTSTKLYYRAEDLLGCRELVALANSLLLLDAVAAVLGTRPTIASFQAWWTLGEHFGGQVHYDDAYHRDVDDLRFVKLFAYLVIVRPTPYLTTPWSRLRYR